MEENNTATTNPTNTGGNNTISLIVGAIVLAGLLGYVIFSSRDAENSQNETSETTNVEVIPNEDNIDEDENMPNVQNGTDEESMMLETAETETTMAENPTEDTASNEDVQTFILEAGSFYFSPNSIIVNKGDTVRIELTAVDMMHDFVIDELGVKLPVTESGKTNSVEFTVNEPGSYEFYCSVGQHRQQGQVGTLIVQE